ncbi:hypothetical protein N9I98_01165 [Flavobacteriales bacterium]|jgi:hypothetical protein|nr:hypothetical protein [Flavobacteriales bacterium]
MEKSKSQFKVGDKVLCMNDAFSVKDPQVMFMNFPKKGREYTIRGFCGLGISMWLEEIVNQPLPGRNEIWFYNWHFRKKENLLIKIKASKTKVKELELV